MITPAPTANAQDVTAKDWIDWAAGDCPVPHDTIVDVRHADGTFTNGVRAGDAMDDDPRYGFNWWAHTDTGVYVDGFIAAYRVVQS